MLPIESVVMRKVAAFYASTGMPVVRGAEVGMRYQLTMPGLWSFVTGRTGRESFGVIARRLSQIGLSVALTLGVEAVFFGFVYALARRDGVGKFGWKRLHHDGRGDVTEKDVDGEDGAREAAIRD